MSLSHWGRMTHICVSKLTIIGSDNGLSPDRRQAIFWTNAGILLIGPLGTNFSEILIEIHAFTFKKMHLKKVVWNIAAILSRPRCVKASALLLAHSDLYTGLACHIFTLSSVNKWLYRSSICGWWPRWTLIQQHRYRDKSIILWQYYVECYL